MHKQHFGKDVAAFHLCLMSLCVQCYHLQLLSQTKHYRHMEFVPIKYTTSYYQLYNYDRFTATVRTSCVSQWQQHITELYYNALRCVV